MIPDKYHGTTTGYDYGCRQECCRAAYRKYRARQIKELKKLGVPSKLHGTRNAYINYSCRCDLCKAANTQYHRELKARKDSQKSS